MTASVAVRVPESKHFSAQLNLFADEPRLYHDPESRGFFSILYQTPQLILPGLPDLFGGVDLPQVVASRKHQRTYRLEELPARLAALDPTLDTWISQAEFFRPTRRIVDLSRVGLAWVDCDTYTVPALRDLSAEQLTGQLLDYCNDTGLPLPSVVIFSGRGLQIKWLFSRALPAKALIRWQALQAELLGRFACFGSDSKASDGSRVLRLVNTVNTKSGLHCRVMWPLNRNLDSVTLYPFDDLAFEVLPVPRQQIKEKRSRIFEQPADRTQTQTDKKFAGVAGYGIKRLWWYRLLDIRKLVQLRQWSAPPPGFQDLTLWLSTVALSWSLQPDRLRLEVEALAREFCPSWKIEQARAVVSTTLQKAKDAADGKKIEFQGQMVDPRYRISNDYLIYNLKITEDEQRQLLTIIGKPVARERDADYQDRKRRKAGAATRTEYLENAEHKKAKARLMAAEGYKQKAIAEALNVDRATVYRYLKC